MFRSLRSVISKPWCSVRDSSGKRTRHSKGRILADYVLWRSSLPQKIGLPSPSINHTYLPPVLRWNSVEDSLPATVFGHVLDSCLSSFILSTVSGYLLLYVCCCGRVVLRRGPKYPLPLVIRKREGPRRSPMKMRGEGGVYVCRRVWLRWLSLFEALKYLVLSERVFCWRYPSNSNEKRGGISLVHAST